MKLNGFLTKCQHPMVLCLGCLPLTWMLLCNVAPHLLLRGSLLPLLTLLFSWLCLIVPGKRRLVAGLAGAALLMAAGSALLPLSEDAALLPIPLLCIAVLLGSLPIAGYPRGWELPTGWHVAAIGAHAVMQALVSITKRTGQPTYNGMQTPLTVSFLICAALAVLALNRDSLEAASQSRRTVPLLMRRQNVVLTLAMLAVGTCIAAIPAIGQAIGTLWTWFKQAMGFLVGLLTLLMSDSEAVSGGSAPAESGALDAGEAVPPSAFAQLMEKVMAIVALMLLAIAAFFLLRALGKQLWRLLKLLWQRLGRYGNAVSEDYEDEITDTRDEDGVERERLLTRLRRFAPEDEKGQTPAQRVRSRYRRLKRRHRSWTSASTARETLPQDAAALYEQARYSGQPLTEADAERFHEGTKRL